MTCKGGDNLQSLSFGSNITSVLLQGVLKKHTANVNQASERLGTGLRINRPSDDAAGYVYSEKLNSKIRGTDVAQRNVNDGIAALKTADTSMTTVMDNVQRIREIFVAALGGGQTQAELDAGQIEINNLVDEIGDLRNNTNHNGTSLLKGGYNVDIQNGPDSNNTYALDLRSGTWDGVDIDTASSGSTGSDIGKLGYQSSKSLNKFSISLNVNNRNNTVGTASSNDLDDLDKIIRNISGMQSSISAKQNRLTSDYNFLTDNKLNLESAKSNVTDADIAHETTRLSVSQVLQQSAVSLLAQANSSPQIALSLIP